MLLQVPAPSDSAALVNMITNFLPGINPQIVALAASYVCTRFIWAVKLFLSLGPSLNIGPVSKAMTAIHEAWRSDPATGKRGLGWIVNPILMIVMGYFVSGTWGMGSILGFAGIGVKEWLSHSPIPTTKAELSRLKGTLALIMTAGLLFLPSIGNAEQLHRSDNADNAAGDGVVLAKQLVATEWGVPVEQVLVTKVPPATPLLSWVRVTLAANVGVGVDEYDYYPWAGGKTSYLLNSRIAIQYDYQKRLNKDDWDHRLGLNLILF